MVGETSTARKKEHLSYLFCLNLISCTLIRQIISLKLFFMKKLFLVPAVIFFAAFTIDPGKWTGYISDSHCGAAGNNEGHASCAKKCIGEGYKPVFVVQDKVYAITNPEKVEKYIGDKVTIEGSISGDTTITIETVSK